jgi:hypothetical protein
MAVLGHPDRVSFRADRCANLLQAPAVNIMKVSDLFAAKSVTPLRSANLLP